MNELRLSFWFKFGLHSLFIGIGFGLTVWVAGCEAFDNPRMILPETKRNVIVSVDSRSDATAECLRRGLMAKPDMYIVACAGWFANNCSITVAPNVSNEVLGHEFRHCLVGDWHN